MTPNRVVIESEAAVAGGAGRLSAAMALVGAVGLFAAMGALVKLVSDRYALGEIIFYRGFFATLVLLTLAPGQGGWQVLRTSRPLGHALRSLAGLTAMACTFAALALLPLAEATALGFTAPLLTAALAVPLLGERVTPQRWLALLLGLAGVLVIVRPGTATFSWGALLGVAGAAFIALAMISIRRLGGTERGLTVALYFQLACTLAGAVSLLFVRHLPGVADLVALVAIGVLGGLAQVLMTRAYMSGPASWIAPFEYSAILWSTLLGFLLWGELPGPAVILGAVLVIGAGLMVMREARTA